MLIPLIISFFQNSSSLLQVLLDLSLQGLWNLVECWYNNSPNVSVASNSTFQSSQVCYPINQFIIGFLRLLKKILSLLNCTLLTKRSLALEFLESTFLKNKVLFQVRGESESPAISNMELFKSRLNGFQLCSVLDDTRVPNLGLKINTFNQK